MSGGHFGYSQHRINDIVSEIETLIKTNNSTEKDDFGQDIGYHFEDDIIDRFREASLTLQRAEAMVQAIDWLVSGDFGPDTFREQWAETVGDEPPVESPWNGWIHQLEDVLCNQERTDHDPVDVGERLHQLGRLAEYLLVEGKMSTNKMARIMGCNIEDITRDV